MTNKTEPDTIASKHVKAKRGLGDKFELVERRKKKKAPPKDVKTESESESSSCSSTTTSDDEAESKSGPEHGIRIPTTPADVRAAASSEQMRNIDLYIGALSKRSTTAKQARHQLSVIDSIYLRRRTR